MSRRTTAQDLVIGHRLEQLAALLRSGVTPPRAVETLCAAERDRRVAGSLRRVAATLQQGRSLAEALAGIDRLRLLGQTVDDCGDRTPEALERLAEHLRCRAELRATGRAATLYPRLLLIGLAALVLLFSHTYVAALDRYFIELGAGSLPALLQQVVERGLWISRSTIALLLAAAVLVALAIWLQRRHPALLARLTGRIPLVGPIVRRLAVAEFLDGFALRLSAGVAPADAYSSAAVTADASFRSWFERSAAAVQASGHLSDGLRRLAGLVRPLDLVLISAAGAGLGDDTAQLTSAARSTRAYLLARCRRSLRPLGPVSLVLVAAALLVVLSGISLPIFELSGTIGK